jgi:hypothetical protein
MCLILLRNLTTEYFRMYIQVTKWVVLTLTRIGMGAMY